MQNQTTKINPYDWINPIEDPKLFAGRREELGQIMDEILRIKGKTKVTPIIAVTGERRVGKTSLLLRIKEKCQEHKIKSIIIPMEEPKGENIWAFWSEIYNGLLLEALNEGINLTSSQKLPIGFISDTAETDSEQPHSSNVHIPTHSGQ